MKRKSPSSCQLSLLLTEKYVVNFKQLELAETRKLSTSLKAEKAKGKDSASHSSLSRDRLQKGSTTLKRHLSKTRLAVNQTADRLKSCLNARSAFDVASLAT